MMSCLLLIWSILAVADKVTEPTIKLEKLPNGKYRCEVINTSKITWYYVGYSPKTMVKDPPADLMFVMPHVHTAKMDDGTPNLMVGVAWDWDRSSFPAAARLTLRYGCTPTKAMRPGLALLF